MDTVQRDPEVCPHCGSRNYSEDDKGYGYRRWCIACDKTWLVEYEEVLTRMTWDSDDGTPSVVDLRDERPLHNVNVKTELYEALKECRAALTDKGNGAVVIDTDTAVALEQMIDAALTRATGEAL